MVRKKKEKPWVGGERGGDRQGQEKKPIEFYMGKGDELYLVEAKVFWPGRARTPRGGGETAIRQGGFRPVKKKIQRREGGLPTFQLPKKYKAKSNN